MDMSTFGRWTKRWWTVRSLRVAALTAGLGLGGLALTSVATAQNGPARSGPDHSWNGGAKKTFTKNTTFHLPIQMDEKVRAQLREVQLYVKNGTSDWVRQEV